MAKPREQFLFFRGIYEFEDPSGGLMAARVPQAGTADLFRDTVVLVRPNQRAMFVYDGKVAEMLGEGTHRLENRNVPVLTRLANWKLSFQSPCGAICGSSPPMCSLPDGGAPAIPSITSFRPWDPCRFGHTATSPWS